MLNIDLATEMFSLKRENNPKRRDATTFSCLGKLAGAGADVFERWTSGFESIIRNSMEKTPVTGQILIAGLAESGIIPSGLCHKIVREQGIDADWICSTRRASSGIRFTESHSHAPDHILPLPGHHPDELWFVEDEMTTGRTVLRLALCLSRFMKISRIRFFAIADIRSQWNTRQFEAVLENCGIEYLVESIIREQPLNGKPLDNEAASGIRIDHDESLEIKENFENCANNMNNRNITGWLLPEYRPAIGSLSDVSLNFQGTARGSLLVIGEAVDLAFQMTIQNPELDFHHVTLSPWEIDGKHITSRMDIFCHTGPGDKYYLYNYESVKTPIYILNDPVDTKIAIELENCLLKKGIETMPLTSIVRIDT